MDIFIKNGTINQIINCLNENINISKILVPTLKLSSDVIKNNHEDYLCTKFLLEQIIKNNLNELVLHNYIMTGILINFFKQCDLYINLDIDDFNWNIIEISLNPINADLIFDEFKNIIKISTNMLNIIYDIIDYSDKYCPKNFNKHLKYLYKIAITYLFIASEGLSSDEIFKIQIEQIKTVMFFINKSIKDILVEINIFSISNCIDDYIKNKISYLLSIKFN